MTRNKNTSPDTQDDSVTATMDDSADWETFLTNITAASTIAQQIAQDLPASFLWPESSITVPWKRAAHVFAQLWSEYASQPEKWMEAQLTLYRDTARLWSHMMQRTMGEDAETDDTPFPTPTLDRRFRDTTWNDHPVYDGIRQSYFLLAQWMQQCITKAESLDDKARSQADFYTRQWLDALSPTNFLLTNPEVIRATLESNGKNLVRGMQQLHDDIQHSENWLEVSLSKRDAYEVGKDLAITPGKVIYQNDLMQLIHYQPAQKTAYQTPLLIIPPWINKYYILDMRPENSFVKWLVDQGHSVFLISWVNPGPELAEKDFEDYMTEGPLAALDVMQQVTGEPHANVIAYCIGGTLMASALSHLHHKKQDDRVRSVTYLTTLVDFAHAGDLGVFVDDATLEEMTVEIEKRGCFSGKDMGAIFRMLRSNDLIWNAMINHYLMGKERFPFDLLYWNADSTALPAKMHLFYLRNMYLLNKLVKKGGITLGGVPINLRAISTPSYILSTKEDHIAPWKATYTATQLYKGPVRFVLSGSGHIAGVVNPPAKQKYGYWTSDTDTYPKQAEDWFKTTTHQPGSWWGDWQNWLVKQGYAGKKITAPIPGNGPLSAIEDAPGSYVMRREGE